MNTPFDPDGAALGDGIYGLPFSPEESQVVLIPVPWEATVSYGAGTARGPRAVLDASLQLDLFDRETGRPYAGGIAMLPIPETIETLSREARILAGPVIEAGGPGDDPELQRLAARVDALSQEMNRWVRDTASRWLDEPGPAGPRLVGSVGGDHATPFGLIHALAGRRPGFGILHLDAHCDLRPGYEGFAWSHASIMYNVMERLPGVAKLVQVGIRDFAEIEHRYAGEHSDRISVHYDADLREQLQQGRPWADLVETMIAGLPDEVYLSFDIDGLDPTLCPHTGTPVPGGLSFPEAVSLVRKVVESGRVIVGFDLSEVAPDPDGRSEWDGNVGARLLYKMIGYARLSRGEA